MCASAAPVRARAPGRVHLRGKRLAVRLRNLEVELRGVPLGDEHVLLLLLLRLHGGFLLKTAEELCDEMRAGAVIVLATHRLVNGKERLEGGHPTLIRVQS